MVTPTIGQTYVATHQGHTWPVVLCDADATPRGFQESRRDDSHLAAIQLGRYKYIWVSPQYLKRYRTDRDYIKDSSSAGNTSSQRLSIAQDTLQKQRETAFIRDAPEFRNDRFWQRFIMAKSEAREITKEQRRNDLCQPNDDSTSQSNPSSSKEIAALDTSLSTPALVNLAEEFCALPDSNEPSHLKLQDWIVERMMERWIGLRSSYRDDLNRIFRGHSTLRQAVQSRLEALKVSKRTASQL
ncbi:hypothetical protein TI39_contig432g00006 [Zymoseptoria brevis]|uniref:Uncharacterized protein n=1 Tax=Zymoseptoria brevis TaxID=1047168 RepID=A0A0F4GM28_9PEZI|nr:hypothetical protein TI39_contig432g00006 [Zymoseptoria brevis]